MKKRWLALLLTVIFLTACTPSGQQENTPTAENQEPQTTQTAQVTPVPTKEASQMTETEKILNGKTDTAYTDTLVNAGDSVRIAQLMRKAQNGGQYTIMAFGGSISQGQGASKPEKAYGPLVCQWWKNNFPQAEFTYVNAGLGATNPEMGCYRYNHDVLPYKPDFTVIDFAVNTYLDNKLDTTYPTLLTRLQEDGSAVMAIYFSRTLGNSYKEGKPAMDQTIPEKGISEAVKTYQIPTVDFHHYIWKYIDESKIAWNLVGSDSIHPNDFGHKLAAELICNHLDYVKAHLDEIGDTAPAIPAPKKDTYRNVSMLTVKSEGITTAGSVNAQAGTSTGTMGWVCGSGKGELTLKVPEGANHLQLFMVFGGDGTIKVVNSDGTVKKTVKPANAATPTLIQVNVSGLSETITIQSDITSGTAVFYGIGVD